MEFVLGFLKGLLGSLFAKLFGTDKETKLEKENIGLRKRVTRSESQAVGAKNEQTYKAGVEKRKTERKNAKSTKERIDNTSRRYR